MSNKPYRYSPEEKQAIIERMMPPNNESVPSLCKELGIPDSTLYTWRKRARKNGYASPGNDQTSDKWSSEDKFLIVMETYTKTETELATYCREKGLYKEQIEAWRKTCLTANDQKKNQTKELNQTLREEKLKSNELEKALRDKEKALAEAASRLLLRKKARAIWGDQEDELSAIQIANWQLH